LRVNVKQLEAAMRHLVLVMVSIGVLAVAGGAQAKKSPTFAIGVNALQPLTFLVGSSFYDETTILPIPLELHGHIKRNWGIAGTIQFLSYSRGEDLALGELLACGGPRYRFTGKALEGLYVTVKVGFGYLAGAAHGTDEYRRLSLALQPEVGYAIHVGNPGLFLAFGGGLQAQIKLIEKNGGLSWSALDKMVIYTTPWLNVTVGFTS